MVQTVQTIPITTMQPTNRPAAGTYILESNGNPDLLLRMVSAMPRRDWIQYARASGYGEPEITAAAYEGLDARANYWRSLAGRADSEAASIRAGYRTVTDFTGRPHDMPVAVNGDPDRAAKDRDDAARLYRSYALRFDNARTTLGQCGLDTYLAAAPL